MNLLSLIEGKRDGGRHSPEQIGELVRELVAGKLPDYQVAAWLMAVYFRGLERDELSALTLAMRDSGERLEFPDDPRPIVDKHSTGGVGDKVSLPLAPLLACLGFRVPMISGRALGITGGTLDKLESIPGFTTQLGREKVVAQVQEIGVAIVAQTERMVPADRLLYALRDTTGTVPSIPLITASILSKKLAESLDALVLDVKFGGAAFMKTRPEAEQLAATLVRLSVDCGVPAKAILSDMTAPLGSSVGNWLEVKESVACLSGRGPADLRGLVIECAAILLLLTGKAVDLGVGRETASATLDSGRPLQRWEQMLRAQGSDLDSYREMLARETLAGCVGEVRAPASGRLIAVDSQLIGEVLRAHGVGRLSKGAPIRPLIGLDRLANVGIHLAEGDLLARVHCENQGEAQAMVSALAPGFYVENG